MKWRGIQASCTAGVTVKAVYRIERARFFYGGRSLSVVGMTVRGDYTGLRPALRRGAYV